MQVHRLVKQATAILAAIGIAWIAVAQANGHSIQLPKVRKNRLSSVKAGEAVAVLDSIHFNALYHGLAQGRPGADLDSIISSSGGSALSYFGMRDPVVTLDLLLNHPNLLLDTPRANGLRPRAEVLKVYQRRQAQVLLNKIGHRWEEFFPGRARPTADELAREIAKGKLVVRAGVDDSEIRHQLRGSLDGLSLFSESDLAVNELWTNFEAEMPRLLTQELAYNLVKSGSWSISNFSQMVTSVLESLSHKAQMLSASGQEKSLLLPVEMDFREYDSYFEGLNRLGLASQRSREIVDDARRRFGAIK